MSKGDYKKLLLKLDNNSEFSITHLLFDVYQLVDEYFKSHPLLAQKYKFNGLWKQDTEVGNSQERIIVIFQEKIGKSWGKMTGQILNN